MGGALQSGLYNVGTGLTYGLSSIPTGTTGSASTGAASTGSPNFGRELPFNPVGKPGSYPFSSPIGPNVASPMFVPEQPQYRMDPYGSEPGYGNYPKNLLRFNNPYNMNRGFMDNYDAVQGPNGDIIFNPR